MTSCAYKLKQGQALHDYAFTATGHRALKLSGRYEVCITPTQHERLFGKCDPVCTPPKSLGCGKYACAYPHKDPNLIVKITHDESDVAATLRAQQVSDRAVKTFGIHKLASSSRFIKPGAYYAKVPGGGWSAKLQPVAYAIEAERLSPLPKAWRRRVNCIGYKTSRWTPGNTPSKADIKRVWACCPVSESKAERAVCHKLARDIVRAKLALGSVGVVWNDIHGGNIGVNAQGRWKALDLGHINARVEDDVVELHGKRLRGVKL